MSSFHVVMDPGGKEWSHNLSLSLSENENRHRQIASVEVSLILNVSNTSIKTERCKLGSSISLPPNWDYCTIEMSVDLSSKLFATTGGMVMVGVWRTPEVIKSRVFSFVLPHHQPWLVLDVPSSKPSLICRCLFNLWKVCSISGSNSKSASK